MSISPLPLSSKPLQRECIARVGKDNADIMVPDVELYAKCA